MKPCGRQECNYSCETFRGFRYKNRLIKKRDTELTMNNNLLKKYYRETVLLNEDNEFLKEHYGSMCDRYMKVLSKYTRREKDANVELNTLQDAFDKLETETNDLTIKYYDLVNSERTDNAEHSTYWHPASAGTSDPMISAPPASTISSNHDNTN